MQKWEYTWMKSADIKGFGRDLDAKGLQGWELVSVTSVFINSRDVVEIVYTAFMKRPLS
jgi:hypothetical protein